MMNNLRAASETWIGRIFSMLLMAFIVASFTIWGIGDFFRGFGSNKLASVGSTEIAGEAFRSAWASQLQRLSARVQKNVTNEEARAAGLDRQLLNQLIGDAAIDQRARQLGLAVSDDEINASVVGNASFKGVSGAFDRSRFLETLRQNNLTERGFQDQQRATLLRQQQVEAVVGGMNPPVVLLEMLNRSRNERRSLDYFLVPETPAAEITLPGEEELKKYYASRVLNFRAPENRALVYLAVRPEALANAASVSDEAAMRRYDDVKAARFTVPEKRQVQQISFPTETEAAEASARIKAGATFDEIARARGLGDRDIDLGLVEKKGLVGDIGPAAFALAERAVSEPVKNVFGVVLLRAVKILPAEVKAFADVVADIKRELALLEARKAADGLREKIEDARTSGKNLTDSAKSVGLEATVVDATDAQGRNRDGQPVFGFADRDLLLKAAFASDVGVDNDTITTRDKGTMWFEVTRVEPSRNSSFDEARAKVEAAWRAEEAAKRLTARTADMVKKLADGSALAEMAEVEGKLEVKHVGDAQRRGAPGLPATVVAQVFNVGVGGVGSALAPGGRIVFKVLDKAVQPLDPASAEAKALETEVRAALSDEIFSGYVAQVQTEAGVKINEPLLRQLTGNDAN